MQDALQNEFSQKHPDNPDYHLN